jgi:hypothetical protein
MVGPLTKSRFKLAINCPTKLNYANVRRLADELNATSRPPRQRAHQTTHSAEQQAQPTAELGRRSLNVTPVVSAAPCGKRGFPSR